MRYFAHMWFFPNLAEICQPGLIITPLTPKCSLIERSKQRPKTKSAEIISIPTKITF